MLALQSGRAKEQASRWSAPQRYPSVDSQTLLLVTFLHVTRLHRNRAENIHFSFYSTDTSGHQTSGVGGFSHSKRFCRSLWSPTGCPAIRFHSDSIDLKLVSDAQVTGSSHKSAPLQRPLTSPGLSPVLQTGQPQIGGSSIPSLV